MLLLAWFSEINAKDLGGSSFVELSTGVNIAVVSWKQFQDQINKPKILCKAIAAEFTCNNADSVHHTKIAKWCIDLARFAASKERFVAKCLEKFWLFTYFLTWGSVVAGFFMLYVNRFCWGDVFILLPWFFYFVISWLVLFLYKVTIIVLNFFCAPASPEGLAKEINQLVKDTQNINKPKP